jgi:hypothetical protein
MIAAVLLPSFGVCGQATKTDSGSAADGQQANSPETAVTFKLRVNVVEVRVVVRDERGNPVENLKQSDFRLFDDGKPQTITSFTVENAANKKQAETAASGESGIPSAVKARLCRIDSWRCCLTIRTRQRAICKLREQRRARSWTA